MAEEAKLKNHDNKVINIGVFKNWKK